MVKITLLLILPLAIIFVSCSSSSLAAEENQIKAKKSSGQVKLDTLEQDGGYERIVELLQERATYQALSLARQRKFIYALICLSILLIAVSVMLVKSGKKKRLSNDLLKLKSLRSQMNPHFIFNALNSVNSFVSSNDMQEANMYLADFSRLMRIVLENSQKDFVSLEEEILALKLYLSLEHLRFQDTFDYTLFIDKSINTDQYLIPPMLMQPYIENAIWHGLRHKKEFGHLSVSITQDRMYLFLSIEDNGVGRSKSQKLKTVNQHKQESTGMKNTEQRINLLGNIYKSDISLIVKDLDRIENTGTSVRIKIPLELMKEI